jgi:hypothetical protein
MGLSKSLPHDSLVRDYDPADWTLAGRTQENEVWQHRLTGHRFSVFPLDLSYEDPRQSLQLYNFRRANSHELVAPELILRKSKDFVCTQEQSYYILL